MSANTQSFQLGPCRFDLLTDQDRFIGIGAASIDGKKVRSGRLPLRPFTQSFLGLQLHALQLKDVEKTESTIRIKLGAEFHEMPVKLMKDHSFDPVHDLADWDSHRVAGTGEFDLVIQLASDCFNGTDFHGFSYHYEYNSENTPIFYIYDMASWELDGDIEGGTVYSQSSCSPPAVTFDAETSWSTEGFLFFLVESGTENPVMTHNLPRWAGHGCFDFQFKGNDTLIGVFEHVDLIRSVICRDAGKPELKTFDKHIFDQSLTCKTSAKSILINSGPKTETAQKNLWSRIFEVTERRARAEFDIREEPMYVSLYQNFWHNFTVDSYYKDLLPAAINIGARRLFLDNLKKSAMTEQAPLPGVWNWNMCCGHEYEISDKLGGISRVKAFIEEAAKHNIQAMIWTNNDQALSSPLNRAERGEDGTWYVLLEDARQKYGGAYQGCMSVLDFSNSKALRYFVDSHKKIREQTGLSALFFDSFYNLGFMPISYAKMQPHTMWRGCLQMVREIQEAGFNLCIESFGPFGLPSHGHPSSYNLDTIFACYRVGLGNDYSTVPTNMPVFGGHPEGTQIEFFTLAHMAGVHTALHRDHQRIDEIWTENQVRNLAVYHDALPQMHTRYLQEDGLSVLWHNVDATQATLFNFSNRSVSLPGQVIDLTADQKLPKSETYSLQECHVYAITGVKLPTEVEAVC